MCSSDLTAIMIVNHNINDIKNKEQELEEAQKKYEKLMNTLPQGVMLINPDGRIESCNKRGVEIFGLTEEQVLGKELVNSSWKAIRADGTSFPYTEWSSDVCSSDLWTIGLDLR